MKMAVASVLAGAALFSVRANSQGCVAARTCGQNVAAMCVHDASDKMSSAYRGSENRGGLFAPGHWSLSVQYRNLNSHRHFVGTQEQVIRQEQGTQVINNTKVMDILTSYQFNSRWSMDVDVPVIRNDRFIPGRLFGVNAPTQHQQVGGIGDTIVSATMWLFRAPASARQNVAFNFGVKLPTGKDDVTNRFSTANGVVTQTADQSVQLGDGGYGIVVGTQAYQSVRDTTLYFTGFYLINPRGVNGVATGRRRASEAIMSVADQYLVRAGVSHAVPRVRGLAMTLGARKEGVPVRDLIGSSDGFRRPGYAFSFEPGFTYRQERGFWSMSVPIALRRNRLRSVPDYQDNRHGDAAFADAFVLVAYTRHF